MLSRPSLFARALEPLVSALWILFVLLSLIVACVWISDFGDAELSRYIANPGLRGALGIFLERLDAAWIALAAVVSYLALAEVEGLATVRRWGFIVIVLVALLAVVNSATSLPLGPLHYTARLGMQIGPMPFGLPLLWFALVTGARSVMLRLLPRASHARVSLCAGALAMLADVNIEPLAWKVRAFWIWYPKLTPPAPRFPPLQNFAAWFVIATALAFTMRESKVAAPVAKSLPRPVCVFATLNAVFLITNVSRLLQRWL